MSYWDHRKPVHRARAVDVHDIARASVALLDEGGLRALTVRAVASRLAVAPASLYSRVESVDDLFDLALDEALGNDPAIEQALADASLHELMVAHYRHLARHKWACQVIVMRAPRGPNYLRLSERIVVLLSDAGVADPLSTSYSLSNFVIGSATTAPVTESERAAPVDPSLAPLYARLHAEHAADPEAIVTAGLSALCARAGFSVGFNPCLTG
ncbi:AcrR family transcriptional regulator [Mycobacterium frederiksbergense]|uniref:AcrR family transcriptional regulator n=1 Tax=Mycolicibacterium frederiksbergense TaxID=117567 RepID=A0ABT6L1Y1_9MYCO|nr:TetR/AcrR family transcriptional regulator [Mycolicibacterium frederiksbergense]MDH6195995.1 AcrR family transcriptional regulator [Mycolicibacterium frederiksbergense]